MLKYDPKYVTDFGCDVSFRCINHLENGHEGYICAVEFLANTCALSKHHYPTSTELITITPVLRQEGPFPHAAHMIAHNAHMMAQTPGSPGPPLHTATTHHSDITEHPSTISGAYPGGGAKGALVPPPPPHTHPTLHRPA